MSFFESIHVSYFVVFLEGILSFLSPCVVPILPIFIGYLAGQTDGWEKQNNRQRMLWHTLFFVLGISTTFLILGISMTSLGRFFSTYRAVFTRSAGIFIILMGLIQIGFLEIKALHKVRQLKYRVAAEHMTPLSAWLMGLTFSFAWTPCVGPMLASVLAMASSAKTAFVGNLLIALYAAGFALPFLVVALFTSGLLKWLQMKEHWLKALSKVGGILLILMGLMLYTGYGNTVSGYLNESKQTQQAVNEKVASEKKNEEVKEAPVPAFDFELKDQQGRVHRLSDYKGKVVFLNFWATWCPPCKNEMPHIQDLYESYGENAKEVVFLSVSHPGGREKNVDGIADFMKTQGYSWPSVMDLNGEVYQQYQITSIPTTFMIDKEGNIYGYIQGQLTKEMMIRMIDETQNK